MTEHNATEQAYKNGYEAGFKAGETVFEQPKWLTDKHIADLKAENEWLKCLNKTWEQALDTKEQLNEEYRKENAELKARIEKAVELPKYLYGVSPSFGIKNEIDVIQITEYDGKIEGKKEVYVYPEDIGEVVFLTREAAEAKLAELKGERK